MPILRPIIHLLNRIAHGLLNYAERNVDKAARRHGWTAEQTEAFRKYVADAKDDLDKPCDHCGGEH
jgi:hypothetical protein